MDGHHHIHIDAKHDVPQALQLTGKYCVQDSRRIREQHKQVFAEQQQKEQIPDLEALGIPDPHAWMTLVGALVQQGEKIGVSDHRDNQAIPGARQGRHRGDEREPGG